MAVLSSVKTGNRQLPKVKLLAQVSRLLCSHSKDPLPPLGSQAALCPRPTKPLPLFLCPCPPSLENLIIPAAHPQDYTLQELILHIQRRVQSYHVGGGDIYTMEIGKGPVSTPSLYPAAFMSSLFHQLVLVGTWSFCVSERNAPFPGAPWSKGWARLCRERWACQLEVKGASLGGAGGSSQEFNRDEPLSSFSSGQASFRASL